MEVLQESVVYVGRWVLGYRWEPFVNTVSDRIWDTLGLNGEMAKNPIKIVLTLTGSLEFTKKRTIVCFLSSDVATNRRMAARTQSQRTIHWTGILSQTSSQWHCGSKSKVIECVTIDCVSSLCLQNTCFAIREPAAWLAKLLLARKIRNLERRKIWK